MALQSSGAISYSDIKTEFGDPTNKNIGAYRVSQNVGEMSGLPLDTGIPKTGAISFSDFYGKQLNIVVDFHSGGTTTRQNARTQYNNNNVTVMVIKEPIVAPQNPATSGSLLSPFKNKFLDILFFTRPVPSN